MKAWWAIILMAASLACACARPAEQSAPAPAKVAATASPARATDVAIEPLALTFEGVLPCADCPGIRTTLVLTRKAAGWAEGTYRLTEAYIDRGVSPIVTTGDWTTLRGDAVDDDASVYELNPDQADRARHFLRVGDDLAVRVLTRDLKAWPKGLPDRLERKR